MCAAGPHTPRTPTRFVCAGGHTSPSLPITRSQAKPLTKPKAGEKVVLDEDIAFKKKQQEEAKALKEAAAKLKK